MQHKGFVRTAEYHSGANVARLVFGDGVVHIETEGKHGDTVVFTTVTVTRLEFLQTLMAAGGLA